jgi:RNA polymerase sigma-70 factor (ECF subfamily)
MDLCLMADARMANLSPVASPADRARDEAMRWFDELRGPVRRYLMCGGAGATDADEAVQETFLRLYLHLVQGRDVANVRAWVYQVARNYIRDVRKSARHQRTVPIDDAMERAGRFRDPNNSPEHNALSDERSRRLKVAVEKLPQLQRECILLRSSGLRYREIADVMGINTNSVGALVQRAVARLTEELA